MNYSEEQLQRALDELKNQDRETRFELWQQISTFPSPPCDVWLKKELTELPNEQNKVQIRTSATKWNISW